MAILRKWLHGRRFCTILPIIWHPWQLWIRLHMEVQIYYRIWKCRKNLSQMSLCALLDKNYSHFPHIAIKINLKKFIPIQPQDLWGISENVNNIFGLFTTHSLFTNSSTRTYMRFFFNSTRGGCEKVELWPEHASYGPPGTFPELLYCWPLHYLVLGCSSYSQLYYIGSILCVIRIIMSRAFLQPLSRHCKVSNYCRSSSLLFT